MLTGNFPDMEIGLNRRTWTMLLDFFGALGGSATNEEPDDEEIPVPAGAHQLLEALLYGSSPRVTLSEEIRNQLYAKKPRSSGK